MARVQGKKYLIGLRENAIQTLGDMNLLRPKIVGQLHEEVLPWLVSKRDNFERDQTDAEAIVSDLIERGLFGPKNRHAQTLKARRDRLEREAVEAENEKQATKERRAERKLAREKRAKDQAKAKMTDEIRRILVDKSKVENPAVNADLLEIHGNWQRGQQFIGAIGGQIMQLYYVVNAIMKLFPAEESLKEYYKKMAEDPKQESVKEPQNPRELVMEQFFVPFLLTAIKELKCDAI